MQSLEPGFVKAKVINSEKEECDDVMI